MQGGRFDLELDYPYTATDGKCKFNKEKALGGIRDYIQLKKEDEDDLLAFVAHYGPTSVEIDASGSGIYDITSNCSPSWINHSVCYVGYGEENGIKYWIVRNSWGKVWMVTLK